MPRNNKRMRNARRGPPRRRGNTSSRGTTGRPYILPTRTDFVARYRATFFASFQGPGGHATGSVTVKQLVDSLPGGSAVWDEVQFKKFDVYGAQRPIREDPESINNFGAWPNIFVTLNNTINANYLGDNPSFVGEATTNNRRSHVGIVPNRLFREAWIPSSRTDALVSVTTEPSSSLGVIFEYEFVIQATMVLRSVAGANIPQAAQTVLTRPGCQRVLAVESGELRVQAIEVSSAPTTVTVGGDVADVVEFSPRMYGRHCSKCDRESGQKR